ncbi:MAG: hypothetical protein EBU00_05030, partial [Alphaproteobacteria bacterium]|nr:hypothetical protein [Alphaproteobacteria bacterium]
MLVADKETAMSPISSLVTDIEAALQDADGERRTILLHRITNLFIEQLPDLNDDHVSVFDEVILCLAAEIELAARIELSEKLADLTRGPRQTVQNLALDEEIRVARPILERSPCVDSSNLVVIAQKRPEAESYFMPVDLYLGGDEHAVGHLLYSRFWMKVLYDCGLVSHDEPFKKLVHQGMILGMDGEKMSKSRGNVINPDDVVKKYGADTLRIYEMFMGPLEKDKPWSTQAIEGTFRFLNRAFRIVYHEDREGGGRDTLKVVDRELTPEDRKILHVTIKKVTEDIEGMRFNTAISQMMVFVNHFTAQETTPREAIRP